MSEDKHPIWYEPHPVTPERKAAIRALGFRIIDLEFKPEGVENPDAPELNQGVKPHNPDTNGDGKVTAAELKAALDAKGISYRGNASKAELQGLLDAANTPT